MSRPFRYIAQALLRALHGFAISAFPAAWGAPIAPVSRRRLVGAGWSSPVARQAHNLKVEGSNPSPAPNYPKESLPRPRRDRRRFWRRCLCACFARSARIPSRKPRSATRTRFVGHSCIKASNNAHPHTTRSARSLPMHGSLARSSKLILRSFRETSRTCSMSSHKPSTRSLRYRGKPRCTPAIEVTVPDVPRKCAPPALNTAFNCAGSPNCAISFLISCTMRSYFSASISRPPHFSERTTTPNGIDFHAAVSGSLLLFPGLTQEISVDPPPISKINPALHWGSSSSAHPRTANRASSSGVIISKSRPVSDRTVSRNSGPLPALRQACVAMHRICVVFLRAIFSAQIFKASIVRAIAPLESSPEIERPSPNLTIRENASTILKLRPLGAAISNRQLFVPRSSAAYRSTRDRDLDRTGCLAELARSPVSPLVTSCVLAGAAWRLIHNAQTVISA